MIPLPDLNILYPGTQQRRDLPISRCGHNLTHRLSISQQRIQITVQKRIEAKLTASRGNSSEKFFQPFLSLLVPAAHGHAARHADQLIDRRIHYRHGLSD